MQSFGFRSNCVRMELDRRPYGSFLSDLAPSGDLMVNAMMDDLELLRDYAVNGSEDSFRTVLERYVGLVYGAALRQVRDSHFAQEITQAVFVILARKAN